MEINYGNGAPYTVGIEEEFQLLSPETLELSPAIETVLAAAEVSDLPQNTLTSELSASCLEMRSPVFNTTAELALKLPRLRERVRKVVESRGVRLAAAGAHPFSESVEQEITPYKRYYEMEKKMGWVARTQAIYGLHIHIAVPDAEHAIRATRALANHVPLFVALSANSPFWRGRHTGLASTRTKIFDLFPRSGLPPNFEDWRAYETHVNRLVNANLIPDYTWCWWDARPHPRLGTVELRSLDAQTNPSNSAALTALAQCIAATAEEYDSYNPLLVNENKWLATRHGLDAQLYNFDSKTPTPVRELAVRLVEKLGGVARDLGCSEELKLISGIVEGEIGAEAQRSVFDRRGEIRDVASYLVLGAL